MAGNVQEKQLRWYNIALMSFITVWGFGNVVNNYANQGLVVVFSWVFIFALYFTPGNDSNLLIVFYVQIMPDDFVMQLHRF